MSCNSFPPHRCNHPWVFNLGTNNNRKNILIFYTQISKSVPCIPVSYTHLRAHETPEHLVCRLLLEKKKDLTLQNLAGGKCIYGPANFIYARKKDVKCAKTPSK